MQYMVFLDWLISPSRTSFLLWLHNIPLLGYTICGSSAGEHMGRLHDLSVMSNVTPNTLRQVLCGHMFLLLAGVYLEIEFLGLMSNC